MKAVLLLGLCAAVGIAEKLSWKEEFTLDTLRHQHLETLFREWKEYFNKDYELDAVEDMRFAIWRMNLHDIARHNSEEGITWWKRLNQFSDLTKEEFKSKILGYKGKSNTNKDTKPDHIKALRDYSKRSHKIGHRLLDLAPKLITVPDSIDWTNHNGTSYVTPIKNQGDCGSCWAFSTTGSLECRGAIATGKLNSLSEQQLVDCSDAEGNDGCDGGLMDDAFEYVKKEGGLCSEDDYPYKGRDGTCKADSCGTKYNQISSYTDVTHDDESALEDNVANGCVSVAVDASDWSSYSRGVYSSVCGDSLDHGVLVVGYGSDSGKDYWKVKNSWGTDWGEDGYILLCRNCDKGASGECGINKEPSYPDPEK